MSAVKRETIVRIQDGDVCIVLKKDGKMNIGAPSEPSAGAKMAVVIIQMILEKSNQADEWRKPLHEELRKRMERAEASRIIHSGRTN